MYRSERRTKSPKEHIAAIFEDYEASARVLQTLTNLSNTVIETALSGQCKFLFEILQNADDAFDDSSKYKNIKLQLTLFRNYLVIQHNGKVFDYYDVERICDYASQIEEVKANDLSKTGYKGLGFKSLFNLSDCIYICSNGYSFRFDKSHWSNPETKPWQVIPIWSEDLPLSKKYTYHQPVNFVLKITDLNQLMNQLKELIDHPEALLYLHRVNSIDLSLNDVKNTLERKVETFMSFHKIVLLKNQRVVSTWLSKTYEKAVPFHLKKCIREVSQFIYPDKIKNAEEIDLTFTLCTDENLENALIINGFCFSTLPTQLRLSLPYHINSLFILNLDRTQFHENEWNEFLIYQIGYQQLNFLKDLAELPHLKNFVIQLLVRDIYHPYDVFNRAFSRGFGEAKVQISWLPAYKHKGTLLKLGEACVDEIHFFKQNFQNVYDKQCDYVIDYDVKRQQLLNHNEATRFNYDSLLNFFPRKYYPMLTKSSYIRFLSYIFEISKNITSSRLRNLKQTPFLKTKNGILTSPNQALLEEEETPIPDFAELNPFDNNYLPVANRCFFINWLVNLGAKRLNTPVQILRESFFQWIDCDSLEDKMNINNHRAIIGYLAKNFNQLTYDEIQTLKKNLLILTESNEFELATSCYLPNAITLEELGKIIPKDKIISSSYNMVSLKSFFCRLGISDGLSPLEVFRKCILVWINDGTLKTKLTVKNYKPIINFLSSEYKKVKYSLTEEEKKQLKKFPVLTCTSRFREAQGCYFDTAVPNVAGLEDVIEKDKLISTQNLNEVVYKFYSSIGVDKEIHPINVIRKSILQWINNKTVQSRINLSNHLDILKYFAEFWSYSYKLEPNEKKILRKFPILTISGQFREVCTCYWQKMSCEKLEEKIPKIECIISSEELVSTEYSKFDCETLLKVRQLLKDLGIRYPRFEDIYDRYCDHLTDSESIKWFFFNLMQYWEQNRIFVKKNKLLNDLKVKLAVSRILAKNNKLYSVTELYSSYFINMHNIDKNAVPLLAYEALPIELEKWLGIKQELDLPCLIELQKAIEKQENLGEKVTLTFFKTLLEQLNLKSKNEIKKYPFKLLSKDNKLTLAKDLYYFEEENAVCLAHSCYLKRIYGMSHKDTLKLAELCGVNILPFSQEVSHGEEIPTSDSSLREFYLERLHLLVFQESKELNESTQVVLKKLFSKINSFELLKCQTILIKYPFCEAVKVPIYFDHLKIYAAVKWKNKKTDIHEYMKKILDIKSNVTEILDLESISDETEWLDYQKDAEKILMIKEEVKKLISGAGVDYLSTNEDDTRIEIELSPYALVDDSRTGIELSPPQDCDINQKITSIDNESILSENKIIFSDDLLHKEDVSSKQVKVERVDSKIKKDDNLPFKQDVDSIQVKPATINEAGNSVCENARNHGAFKQKICIGQANSSNINQSLNSKTENIIKQEVNFEQSNVLSVNECADFNDEQDNLSLLKDTNFVLKEPICDNTLKEFYLQRLPFIVQWESKKQRCKPKKILKRLYNKIATIELYQCSDIQIQYPYTYVADTYCFFDDMKIYVVGRWSDRKTKIHQYIKEKVGLHSDVADIMNVEPISKIVAEEKSCPKEDESQKLHQIEEAIKLIVAAEETPATQLPIPNDLEYPKDPELLKNKETVGAFSSGNSNNSSYYKPSSSNLYYRIITQIVEEGNICLEEEKFQELHKVEQDIKGQAAEKETKINEVQITEKILENTLQQNKDFIAEVSQDENSEDFKSSSPRPCYSVNFNGSKVFITFSERTGIEQSDSILGNVDLAVIKFDAKITPKKLPVYYRAQKSRGFSNLQVEPEKLLPDVADNEYHLQRLGEEYVYTFLQDYYKNMYPDTQINCEQSYFTLQCQSHIIEIIWVNKNEDMGLEYDLILKKNEEIKQYIEVKLFNLAEDGATDVIHSIFSGNKLTVEHEKPNAKNSIYCIFYEEDSNTLLPKNQMNVNALYKIVPLKVSPA